VATYAHELYCEPHQLGLKGRLLSRWQKRTVGDLLRQSDAVFSSTHEYVERIVEQLKVPRERTQILPIGPNVPVSRLRQDQRERARHYLGWSPDEQVAVVFGSFASQIRTLERFTDVLMQGLRQSALQRVVAVGGQPGPIPRNLRSRAKFLQAAGRVDLLGHQPASRIGLTLQAADFAVIAYPRHLLRKSGVFTAYACAGLAVLSLDDVGNKMTRSDDLPILEGEHWSWADAGSKQVESLRDTLCSYARQHWTWDGIAEQALHHMQRSRVGGNLENSALPARS
jgi:hypothetical protein